MECEQTGLCTECHGSRKVEGEPKKPFHWQEAAQAAEVVEKPQRRSRVTPKPPPKPRSKATPKALPKTRKNRNCWRCGRDLVTRTNRSKPRTDLSTYPSQTATRFARAQWCPACVRPFIKPSDDRPWATWGPPSGPPQTEPTSSVE